LRFSASILLNILIAVTVNYKTQAYTPQQLFFEVPEKPELAEQPAEKQ
jgi:hypothetical protein